MTNVEGWIFGRLGELCSIEIGGTPSRNNSDYWDADKETDNHWVSIKDLNQRVVTSTEERISALGAHNSNVKLQPAGTILLSFKLTIGRVAYAGTDLYTNEAIAGIRSEEIDSDYLFHGLQSWNLLQDVDQAIKGSTLNKKKLKEIAFVYPESKDEQKKVAAILSTIDKAIAQTEAIIAKQQRIKSALMQDLLTRGIDEHGNIRSEETHAFKDSPLGRIPVEWDAATLQDISVIIDPNPSHRYPITTEIDVGVPIASTENFCGENDFDLSSSQRVSFDVYKFQKARCQFDANDIIFARKGRLGFARFHGGEPKVFSHTVVLIKPKTDCIASNYLLWGLRYSDFFDQISRKMNSNSGVPTLGVEFLGDIPLRVPPINEQRRIAFTIDKLAERIESDQKSLHKLRRQKTALMQDLLTGKVRVTPLLEATGA
jgi:type I restriction enzyme, S subunit